VTRITGPDPSPGSATPAPGSHSSDWRRPPTAPTGRDECSRATGDFLYAARWRTGFANQPTAVNRHDGLTLRGAWITAPVRCAPPGNKPAPDERDRCRPFLERELALLPDLRVYLPLGQFGYQALCRVLGLRRAPRFGHGVELALDDGRVIVCSYHVSQQNTFTGKLTEDMFDAVLRRARKLADLGGR
jgi:uracil-DNA glycosylase